MTLRLDQANSTDPGRLQELSSVVVAKPVAAQGRGVPGQGSWSEGEPLADLRA